ncbi:MAG TPA: OB-fold nucleic acid binding domain-containing protein, partial [Nitrolancea sp.]|nr:OB-fold nucleic acid binding domain-containing protein [Nitrolancea sp.]
PAKTLLTWEKELLGCYLSSHPLNDYLAQIRQRGMVQLAEIDEESVGQTVELIALVAGLRKLTTKTNRTMAVVELEDQSGSIEAVFFPETYDAAAELLELDAIVHLSARADQRNDRIQLVANRLTRAALDRRVPQLVREVHLRLPRGTSRAELNKMHRLRTLLDEFPGDDQVVLHLPARGAEVALLAGLRIDWCGDLSAALGELLGEEHVGVVDREELVPAAALAD